MSKTDWKAFVRRPLGKLILACSALILVWVVILFISIDNIPALLPDHAAINAMRDDVKKARAECDVLTQKAREFRDLKEAYRKKAELAWQEKRDGETTVLRDLIESAAKKADIKLSSLGTVRTSKINSEFHYAELDFSAVDEVSKLTDFLAQVEAISPKLYWRRAEIRTEMNFRPPQQTQNNSANKTAAAAAETAQKMRLSAAVRVICYAPENTNTKEASK